MMTAKVMVVGGGIAGMSSAIALHDRGFAVELIEVDPAWRVYGAGITITGPTLRAFASLGILDQVRARGYTGDGLVVRNVAGEILSSIPTPVRSNDEIPGTGGIMRPVLHGILSAAVRDRGIAVRLGCTVDSFEHGAHDVAVRLSDGSSARYDLVVGADGVQSQVRSLLFPDAPRPEFTGQACWRLVARRSPEIDRRCYFLGGPVKVGLTPVSATEMYMFLLERTETKERHDESDLPGRLRTLLAGYGGPLAEIRDSIDDASRIVYRPLEVFEMPAPWSRGRVQLIGDAVHPTTPQLASGAGLAAEDGLVLADELAASSSVEEALARFMKRRWARCRLVVETSLEIGRLEQRRAPVEEQTALVAQTLEALAAAI